MTSLRQRIVDAAMQWRGTPYCHQASQKGAGCDCLGLVRGVWREVFGEEPETPPPYTPDWAEMMGEETLLTAARNYLVEIPVSNAVAGDVLLFRMGLGTPAKHAAIVTGPDSIIHAYWGKQVCETRLVPWWRRRIAGAFSFPNVFDEQV